MTRRTPEGAFSADELPRLSSQQLRELNRRADDVPSIVMNHRAAYARRFNARAIARPRPPAPSLTDEQIAALPTEHARAMARMGRDLRLASEQLCKPPPRRAVRPS